ncbi:Asp-tRNA(Asn)/Glu-tRNA(Gln) amidotransferase subunit GatB [Candidatus Shapirobacteria bacterium]|nr:Asp-tRNA(Asn)/Glu-tRNA(Gln) amidotransferase subunit GatB [Candidatus Shapirobacteria bacterium]
MRQIGQISQIRRANYQPIIGLEIHIELKTKSKMFCGCPADHFGKPPNTQTCPVCLGLPGALPVPNRKAVEWTIMAGLALGCQIPGESKFDRKNYFYPDLPKGYQISQYDQPLAISGKLGNIGICRVHLEEDTGKLVHVEKATLIDFNRSGVPLMEIVTEPDLTSSDEAKEFLQNLQRIIKYLGISEADMEKGQMRCEPTVNLEIKKGNLTVYTPLAEIKNINSFRFVKRAIDFEVQRQFEEFERTGIEKQAGNKVTRGWNEQKGITILQREKEEAADYRYFPEPDIPPMRFERKNIEDLRKKLPELPEKRARRFIREYGVSEYNAAILIENKGKADFFEEAVSYARELEKPPGTKAIGDWIVNKRVDLAKTSPENLLKAILAKAGAATLDDSELIAAITSVLGINQKAVIDYNNGKEPALMFLVGQVLRRTKGKGDPGQIRLLLEKELHDDKKR